MRYLLLLLMSTVSAGEVTYGTNLGGIYYDPNHMGERVNEDAQWLYYRSKGFVTKEEAGLFVDDRPDDEYVVHKSQVCVKEQVSKKELKERSIDGLAVRVKCRQPDGNFAYVP